MHHRRIDGVSLVMRRVAIPIVAAVAVVALVVGLLVAFAGGKKPTHVTAYFDEAVALYSGNKVRVLGIPVGTITKVQPQGTRVRVDMTVDGDVKIPQDAQAYIVPPSLISDRYVQLQPAYTSGPVMPDHYVIPENRAHAPVELDEILKSLDQFAVALGPNGANRNGALSRLTHVGAQNLAGNGQALHEMLTNLSRLVDTLSSNRGNLVAVITNLAKFSQTIANSDATVALFNNDLAKASTYLAEDRADLSAALQNLGIAFGEVASLVRDHRAELGQDIHSLAAVTTTLLKHERSLIDSMDVTPLSLSNFGLAVPSQAHVWDIRSAVHAQNNNPAPSALCGLLQQLGIVCTGGTTGAASSAGPDVGLSALLGGAR